MFYFRLCTLSTKAHKDNIVILDTAAYFKGHFY